MKDIEKKEIKETNQQKNELKTTQLKRYKRDWILKHKKKMK